VYWKEIGTVVERTLHLQYVKSTAPISFQ